MKYLLTFGGGLGDIILSYLMLESGYIKSLKEREPNCKIRAAIMSHNPNVVEFFAHTLAIDEIFYKPWDGNPFDFFRYSGDGCTPMEITGQSTNVCAPIARGLELNPTLGGLSYERPEIYMDEEEIEVARDILSGGKFIVLHPFAGAAHRNMERSFDLIKVIDALCDAGVRVVVVGGTSNRIEGSETTLVEELSYERDGLVNLVNKHSVRLHAYLTTRAHRFIGTMSCYSCAAIPFKVPCLVFADVHRSQAPKGFPWNGIMDLYNKNETKLYHFDQLPKDIFERIVRFAK